MATIDSFDVVTEGLNLLPSMWQDKTKVMGLMQSLLEVYQLSINDFIDLPNHYSLFDAQGIFLDQIGVFWKVKRNERTDSEYQLAIYREMVSGISNTTPNKIKEILRTIFGNYPLKLYEHSGGQQSVGSNEPPRNTLNALTIVYVEKGVETGVKQVGDNIVPAGTSFAIGYNPTLDSSNPVPLFKTASLYYEEFALVDEVGDVIVDEHGNLIMVSEISQYIPPDFSLSAVITVADGILTTSEPGGVIING